MIHRRRREALHVNAEINMTNLIDVAFVLLIIFMITAPIMQGGVPLELPKGDATPVETPDAVVVSVTKDGAIFIDETPVTLSDFPAQIKRYEGKSVSFRGDVSATWGMGTQVLNELRKAGITKLNVVLEPDGA